MSKRFSWMALIVAPALFAAALAGCFNYNPEDLPGYDAAVDEPGDATDMDVQVEDQGPDRTDVDAQPDPTDAPDGTDQGDLQDAAEDPREDEFVPDWEVPPTCGNGTVEPPDEDCDGDPDEPCTTACDTEGVNRCMACKWICFPPPDDDCNGVDENCDTVPDEGYVPSFSCGAGVCESDSFCLAGVEDCTPGDPTGGDTDCNGIDEDCSGVADDHYAPPAPCGRGVCQSDYVCTGGIETCTPGSQTGPDTDCNGLDDNCNGACDEGYSTATTCGVGPCERFYQCVCGSESCSPGTPLAPYDTSCNGVDDDCDSAIDDDYVPSYCGLGVCRRPSTCTAGIEECTPGPAGTEICDNGLDDDCDASIDENCGGSCTTPSTCPGSTLVTSPNPTGGRFSATTTGSSAYSGSCGGGSAPEALYHFVTTSVTDIFITTHGSAINTVVYVRECTCDGAELACNDDADGMNTSVIHLRDLPAGTYNVFIDGKNTTDAGSIQVDVYVTSAGSEGDRCGDPIRLTGTGYTYQDPNSTCFLGSDYAPATTGSGAGDCARYVGTGLAEEMVFYFWVPANGTAVTMSTCGSVSLPSYITDSAVYVRTVCNNGGAAYQPACSDDDRCAGGSADDYLSELQVTLSRGLYYVVVDGYYQEDPLIHTCGEFRLDVTGIP